MAIKLHLQAVQVCQGKHCLHNPGNKTQNPVAPLHRPSAPVRQGNPVSPLKAGQIPKALTEPYLPQGQGGQPLTPQVPLPLVERLSPVIPCGLPNPPMRRQGLVLGAPMPKAPPGMDKTLTHKAPP